jgi:hypothetical protein
MDTMDDVAFLHCTVIVLGIIAILSEVYRIHRKANDLKCEICRWKLKQEVELKRDELATALAISRKSVKGGSKDA